MGRRADGPGAVQLRCGAPADAPRLASIAARSFPDAWSEAAFRGELGRPSCRVRVALAGDAAIAYALGWLVADEAQLLSLAVDPPWRGRGIGRTVLESWLGPLRRQGFRRVSLEVRASNRAARTLYASLGLEAEGERSRYYGDGEDAVLYGAELK